MYLSTVMNHSTHTLILSSTGVYTTNALWSMEFICYKWGQCHICNAFPANLTASMLSILRNVSFYVLF